MENSTICNNCVEHSTCLGGDVINIQQGYWRSSTNSTNIIECSYSIACIGGSNETEIINYNNNIMQKIYLLCINGYGGNLCQKCLNVEGVQYVRAGKGKCTKCPSSTENILKLIGAFLALLIGCLILVNMNLKSNQDQQLSVAAKIFTNYL